MTFILVLTYSALVLVHLSTKVNSITYSLRLKMYASIVVLNDNIFSKNFSALKKFEVIRYGRICSIEVILFSLSKLKLKSTNPCIVPV